jgi:copper resistance protein B
MSRSGRGLLLALAVALAGQAGAQELSHAHAHAQSQERVHGHAHQHQHQHEHQHAHGHADGQGHDGRQDALVPVPPLTDADRAAAFPRLGGGMQHATGPNAFLLFDRLETRDGEHGSGQAWDVEGWVGGDIHRLWLRSAGERGDASRTAAHLELLYGRAVAPWWDVVAGVRHDFSPGGSQDWLAVGVQGLAPWMVELSVTGYVGEGGRTMLGIEAERDLLLTNRLVLQPALEATFHGQGDPGRRIGSGLSTVEAGLRLRYEAHRRFAPYIGLVHERSFGDTAAMHRSGGRSGRHTGIVLGARIWF